MSNRSIRTIEELDWANENDFGMVQHYLQQVTIDEDLQSYLKYLNDYEVTTKVNTQLKRYGKRSAGIHPSSASKKGGCLLKIYYEVTLELEPCRNYDQKSQLTWDLGTLLHDTLQTHLNTMYGDQFEDEVKLEAPEFKITSQTDGIFSFTNYRIILEAKSIKEGGNYGWEKVQNSPMVDNVRQAHFYMWLADVPFALIFYMNKNAGEWKEHAITFNWNIWDELMNEVVQPVLVAATGGPMVEASPSWHCRWCAFAHSCPEKGGEDDIASY